jgi:hypothetical protein
MQVLSVRQPWAWAIARGHKAVENRTWDTPYRGTLAIHASLRVDADALEHPLIRSAGWDPADPLTATGGIIAVVSLAGMCGAAKAGDRCGCGQWAEPGSFHWQLTDVRALRQPIMTLGQPGLWTLGREAAAATAEALAGLPVPAGHSH